MWQDRLPAKYHDVGPRIVRAPMGEITFVGGKLTVQPGTEGVPTDWWYYEELRRPLLRLDAAVGVPRDEVTITGVTYEDMRPGSYQVEAPPRGHGRQPPRGVAVLPDLPPLLRPDLHRGRGQGARRCCACKAYNDWMVDEWCAESDGRLIPLCLIPLWDAELAAAEVRRNAARGVRAVCFSEIPPFLGLPSVHDPDNYWDPFFAACAETSTVVNMHIGSSSKMPSTSADAPPAVGSTLTHTNATFSMVDFLFSGVLVRFPDLKLAYSEGQIGWIPYILERADKVWEENRGWGGVADKVPEPPVDLLPPPGLRLLLRRRPRPALGRGDRRRQHHLRVRLPALGLHLAPHPGDRRAADGAPRRRARATRSSGATPSGSSGSTTWRPSRPGSPVVRGPALLRRRGGVPRRAARLAGRGPARRCPPKPSHLDWPGRRAYDTDWQRLLFDAGYAGHRLAGRGRRPRREPRRAAHLPRGARAGPRPLRRGELRRACSTPARPSIAEGTPEQRARFLPAHPARRRGVVPGLLRARRRERPGLAAHPGRARRRRVRRHRARRSGRRTPRWPTTASCWCAPGPRTAATGASRG